MSLVTLRTWLFLIENGEKAGEFILNGLQDLFGIISPVLENVSKPFHMDVHLRRDILLTLNRKGLVTLPPRFNPPAADQQ